MQKKQTNLFLSATEDVSCEGSVQYSNDLI